MKQLDFIETNCSDAHLQHLVLSGARAALLGGEVLKERYGEPHQVRMKGEIDLVTEADLASEKLIVDFLQKQTPEVNILAEESAEKDYKLEDGSTWIIDPLDGTTNFAHGFPVFAVSIGLMADGIIKAGMVYCPLQEELFVAWQGGGTWLNGNRVRVSETDTLISSLVATGFPYDIRHNLGNIMLWLGRFLPVVRDIRRAGAAAVDLAWVSCGRLDGFYEQSLKPWDCAAGWILVEEAGGRLSDFRGNDFSPFVPELVASNSRLHQLMLELLT